ncbi:MAG: S9 family peptidase, partial [Acidobacteriota bacterium]
MRMSTVLAGGLLAAMGLGVVAGAQGVAKRPMRFEDLDAMKRVGDPQISPSGKWVLFAVTDVVLAKNSKTNHLWVVPIDGAAKERQISEGSGESEGRFSPDGKWVMYAANTAEGKGQLFVAAWDDAKGKMGKGKAVTSLETEADGGVWAPDSKHFLFVSEVYPECESMAPLGDGRNQEELDCNRDKDAEAAKSPVKGQVFDSLLYRHWDHYQGKKRSHVFYGSVETPSWPTDLTPAKVIGDHVAPTFSLGGPTGYAISPDGREVAYVVNLEKVPAESTNNDVFTLRLGHEPWEAKKVSTAMGSDDGPAYSPDGKWLAWRSQKRDGFESDKFDLVVMDRATGAIKDLTTKFENWVDEFAWSSDSKQLYYATGVAGREAVQVAAMALRSSPGVGRTAGSCRR